MYRPEGWDIGGNPVIDGVKRHNYKEGDYEAGADAMLEGLRKGATRVNNIGDLPQGKGVIVFIPEEQE